MEKDISQLLFLFICKLTYFIKGELLLSLLTLPLFYLSSCFSSAPGAFFPQSSEADALSIPAGYSDKALSPVASSEGLKLTARLVLFLRLLHSPLFPTRGLTLSRTHFCAPAGDRARAHCAARFQCDESQLHIPPWPVISAEAPHSWLDGPLLLTKGRNICRESNDPVVAALPFLGNFLVSVPLE